MLSTLTLDKGDISYFMQSLALTKSSLTDYLYKVLTGCVDVYVQLPIAQDYAGEYDRAYDAYAKFTSIISNGRDMPHLKELDIRVVHVPLQAVELERVPTLLQHTAELQRAFDSENPPIKHVYLFTYMTMELVRLLEAQYLKQDKGETTKLLLFSRHRQGLCVFVS